MKILTPEEAKRLWPHLGPGILRALSRNGRPSGLLCRDLLQAIFNGAAHVIVGDEGFGVVFIDRSNKDEVVCNLVAYEGTIREIKLLKDAFIAGARAHGCHKIRITGDVAWMRIVPELKLKQVVMEMDILDNPKTTTH